MNIRYRPCTHANVGQVLEFWQLAAIGGSTNNREAIQNRLTRDPALFLLAWDEDKLVGTLIGGWDGWRASMHRLAVHPDYRRFGIASELVRRVEAELLRRGASRVYALSVRASKDAAPFWRAMEYEPNPTIEPLVKRLGSP